LHSSLSRLSSDATHPTELYPLSLHDALPNSGRASQRAAGGCRRQAVGHLELRTAAEGRRHVGSGDDPLLDAAFCLDQPAVLEVRSEEHTSELQSRENLVCRLLLEKKNR